MSVLEHAIGQKATAHAYLFSGPRGTGKTSVARIFARELGVTANDLYEIDAASNTSVDDIRELSEAVNTIPFESPYKVYILDEVHMLSKSAFNAFLKTLEEPPKHVIFILATTELEKLPDTIVSRCQTFVFKKPTTDVLKKVVLEVSKKEKVKIEPAAAELVALLGDGSFRDTLSILQKVIGAASGSSSAGEVTVTIVEEVTGAPKSTLLQETLESLVTGKLDEALLSLTKAKGDNIDMKMFTRMLIARVRQLLLIVASPQTAKVYEEDFSAEESERMKKLTQNAGIAGAANGGAHGATPARLASILAELLTAYQQVGRSHVETLPLEVAFVRIVGEGK